MDLTLLSLSIKVFEFEFFRHKIIYIKNRCIHKYMHTKVLNTL